MSQFVCQEREDTYGILKLQNKILEIMMYLEWFCREHEITYYLMGGSALGAMRHGGFIPWDDDLDIFMDYPNYQKFKECCRRELDTRRFYFQCEDTAELPYFFSKIRMNGTTCIDKSTQDKKMHKGVFVDVMCLNQAADSGLLRRVQFYAAGLLKAKACLLAGYHTTSKKKKAQLFIADLVVRGRMKKWLLSIVRRYNGKQTGWMGHFFGRAGFQNACYPAEDFGKPRYVPFERVLLPVPQNVEDYLTRRYGARYMELPDEKTKSRYAAHAMLWDVETDYREYETRTDFMTVQVLVAAMHQTDHSLLEKMNIQGGALVGNQCDKNEIEEFTYQNALVRYLSFAERGVGLNRNNTLMRATADICCFADDDMRFLDGYEQTVVNAFLENSKADVLLFNLIEKEKQRFVHKKRFRINRRNFGKYGAARMAIRRERVLRAGISFNLLFGGGAKYSAGEDSLFLSDCLRKGLRVYAVPYALAEIDQSSNSSWFQGYTEKFFADKGVLYAVMSPCLCRLLCLRYVIRHFKRFRQVVGRKDAYHYMLKGVRAVRHGRKA